MPSPRAARSMVLMRSMRPIISQLSDTAQRVGMDASGLLLLPMRGIRGRIVRIHEHALGLWLTPKVFASDRHAVLYLHGGAYVSGGLPYARILGSCITGVSGLATLAVAYRLAPEHPFPAALEDVYAAWLQLRTRGYAAENIAIVGESAGGGLALALTMWLRDAGETLPGAVVCMSPWADLRCPVAGAEALAESDPSLDVLALRQTALKYAPEALLDHPLISPVNGDYTGFPPVLLQVGGAEVLLGDSQRVARRMRDVGAPVTLEVYPDMCHVFQIYGWQESRHALSRIGVFLRQIQLA